MYMHADRNKGTLYTGRKVIHNYQIMYTRVLALMLHVYAVKFKKNVCNADICACLSRYTPNGVVSTPEKIWGTSEDLRVAKRTAEGEETVIDDDMTLDQFSRDQLPRDQFSEFNLPWFLITAQPAYLTSQLLPQVQGSSIYAGSIKWQQYTVLRIHCHWNCYSI